MVSGLREAEGVVCVCVSLVWSYGCEGFTVVWNTDVNGGSLEALQARPAARGGGLRHSALGRYQPRNHQNTDGIDDDRDGTNRYTGNINTQIHFLC